jgi:hypothetical protein
MAPAQGVIAAGAASVITAAAAAAYLSSQQRKDERSIIIFLEGSPVGGSFPAHESLPLLLSEVEARVRCAQPRLFVRQVREGVGGGPATSQCDTWMVAGARHLRSTAWRRAREVASPSGVADGPKHWLRC